MLPKKSLTHKQEGHDVVVVVSAMYGETDRLIQLSKALLMSLIRANMMYLVSTGEQVSMALLSMALNAKNCPARSYTGSQIGIMTDNYPHQSTYFRCENRDIIKRELDEGYIVVVAGFQGVNEHGDITTLRPRRFRYHCGCNCCCLKSR